ncbi:hypothetical protein RO3G_01663 [Rhizopus delemar RA 99-880]|uniref:Uncharacterized protein n=1 Tax=Rhizopus delemar (strain RA 99-880 / ATCC MYA-4621 / FGSC 9543 / NRRL 43880) TaxID=246409 RepID=I1BL79_RHIO9|nr:hypothetical protein RO3G_01663 [Rhizopus delemar RA 99-880]|eukprot:EIE76959.1 hypothetical protein RO3G_01663 [Rhizopus delemar RA 99-880]
MAIPACPCQAPEVWPIALTELMTSTSPKMRAASMTKKVKPVKSAIKPAHALLPRFIRRPAAQREGNEANHNKKLRPAPIKYRIKLAIRKVFLDNKS